MTKARPAEERREDLLATARKLFVTQGISGTTLGEVTSAAGVSKGLFYLYFSSKEDLVLAMKEQFSSKFATDMQRAISEEDDWAAKLDGTVDALSKTSGTSTSSTSCSSTTRTPRPSSAAPREYTPWSSCGNYWRRGRGPAPTRLSTRVRPQSCCFMRSTRSSPEPHGYLIPKDDEILLAAKELFRRAAGL